MKTIEAYPALFEIVQKRFSCRKYSGKTVSDELIRAVIDLARLAPSAVNRQPWEFLVVTDHDSPQYKTIASAYDREWFAEAPAVIVALGLNTEAWHRGCDGKDHTDVDLAIAVEHICLGATSLGLGSCWVCNFDPEKLSADLGLPEGVTPVALIPIGYPADDVVPEKKRKPFDEIVKWGKYC